MLIFKQRLLFSAGVITGEGIFKDSDVPLTTAVVEAGVDTAEVLDLAVAVDGIVEKSELL